MSPRAKTGCFVLFLMFYLTVDLAVTGTACLGQEPAPIDWNRARELRRKEVTGQPLTDDEKVYLERAKAALARRGQQPGPDAGIRGDGVGEQVWVPPIRISLEESPIERIEAKAQDERTAHGFYRKPPGEGPFPAIVFLHGGLRKMPDENLRRQLVSNPTYTRLLASGYAIVASTFRTYEQDVQSRGPIWDSLAIVEEVRSLPAVDGRSVVVFGGSGGGNIALELAGLTELPAIVCGEPATILYTGMLTTGEYGPRLEMMANPRKYWTEDLKERTRAKLKTIRCPVLILHGDIHDLRKMNGEIFVPEMRAAGIEVEYKVFPGNTHGFYFGSDATKETVDRVVAEVGRFLEPRLACKPVPWKAEPSSNERDASEAGKPSP